MPARWWQISRRGLRMAHCLAPPWKFGEDVGMKNAQAKSKNDITIRQLNIMGRHFWELTDAGVTDNIAIRQAVKMTDIYAKMRVIGKCSVDRADEFSHWSVEAIKLWNDAISKNPKEKYGAYLRIEHGTPRTQFTHLVLKEYKRTKLLTIEWLAEQIEKNWKVAVITREEDKNLSQNGGRTNKYFKSPERRWADAGIKFPIGSRPDAITNPDTRKHL
jgi:hypothetical protein